MDDQKTSELPVKRTREEIDHEYTVCATLLGDKSFKIKFLSVEVSRLSDRMGQLNQELIKNYPEVTNPKACA